MADYLDAVFAYFGEDETNDELKAILMARVDPTEQEQQDILGANDGGPEGIEYCRSVAMAHVNFITNPAGYLATVSDDDPRKVGLYEIARQHKLVLVQQEPRDPITAAERQLLTSTHWINMRTALEKNLPNKREVAELICKMMECGQLGVEGKICGSLMRKCINDLNADLNVKDPAEFRRRYYA